MSMTSTPSSSDHDHQIPEPSMKSTLSPSLPFKHILDKYYALAENDRDGFNDLIQPRHTTKASILLHAVSENAITYTDYLHNTFSILIEYHYPSTGYPAAAERGFPTVMCIDEGSMDEFKRELERTFKDNVENIVENAARLEIQSFRVHFTHADYENGYHRGLYSSDPFGKDTHALLRLLKTRGSVEKIVAHCGLRRIERSLEAKDAGSVRSGWT